MYEREEGPDPEAHTGELHGIVCSSESSNPAYPKSACKCNAILAGAKEWNCSL